MERPFLDFRSFRIDSYTSWNTFAAGSKPVCDLLERSHGRKNCKAVQLKSAMWGALFLLVRPCSRHDGINGLRNGRIIIVLFHRQRMLFGLIFGLPRLSKNAKLSRGARCNDGGT